MERHCLTSTGEYPDPRQNGGGAGNSTSNNTLLTHWMTPCMAPWMTPCMAPWMTPWRGREVIWSPGATSSAGSSRRSGQGRGPMWVESGNESESHNRGLCWNERMRNGNETRNLLLLERSVEIFSHSPQLTPSHPLQALLHNQHHIIHNPDI